MATYTINEGTAAGEATNVSDVTYASLSITVADFIGWSRNTEGAGDDWDEDSITYRLSDIINSGYLQAMYPPILPGENVAHRWSFLRPDYPFDTVADTYLYDMPATFGAIVGDVFYDSDSFVSRVISQVSPGLIDRERAASSTAGKPSLFALRPKSVAQTTAQVWEMMLNPTPDAIYSLKCYYDVQVVKLSATNLYPLGGQALAETILQSCLDIAAQRYQDDPAGREHDLFMQRLGASVESDRRNAPQFLGYNNDNSTESCVTRHGNNFTCTLRHNLGGGP